MNKIFTQRKMKLSSFENPMTNESKKAYLDGGENALMSEANCEPSDRVIQNILNYAKSLEVIKLKNNVSFIIMN